MAEKWLNRAKAVLDTEIQGLAAVRDKLDASFVRALEMLAGCTGRVVVTGLGKSGLVGRKIAATFSSTGTPAFFLHPVEGAHGDLGMIRREDMVLAISNSGETDELNNILPSLKSLSGGLVALTGGLASTIIPPRSPWNGPPKTLRSAAPISFRKLTPATTSPNTIPRYSLMVRPSMPGVVVTIMPRRPPFPAMSFHRDKRTRTHGLRWSPFISSPRTFVLFTRGLSRIIVGPRGDGGKRNSAIRV